MCTIFFNKSLHVLHKVIGLFKEKKNVIKKIYVSNGYQINTMPLMRYNLKKKEFKPHSFLGKKGI